MPVVSVVSVACFSPSPMESFFISLYGNAGSLRVGYGMCHVPRAQESNGEHLEVRFLAIDPTSALPLPPVVYRRCLGLTLGALEAPHPRLTPERVPLQAELSRPKPRERHARLSPCRPRCLMPTGVTGWSGEPQRSRAAKTSEGRELVQRMAIDVMSDRGLAAFTDDGVLG
jgi:hypothetical protein